MNKVIVFLFIILLIGSIVVTGCASQLLRSTDSSFIHQLLSTSRRNKNRTYTSFDSGNLAIDGDRMVKAANLAFEQADLSSR